jgi:hypothetical protein
VVVKDISARSTDVGDQEDIVQVEQDDPTGQVAAEAREGGRHHTKDGAERHPLIDLSRDPNPGVADHAAPEEE